MLDFLYNEIALSDHVVFIAPGYRSLVVGKVIGFTPKKVKVSYRNNWNYPNGNDGGYPQEILQDPKQLCRIDEENLVQYLIKNS